MFIPKKERLHQVSLHYTRCKSNFPSRECLTFSLITNHYMSRNPILVSFNGPLYILKISPALACGDKWGIIRSTTPLLSGVTTLIATEMQQEKLVFRKVGCRASVFNIMLMPSNCFKCTRLAYAGKKDAELRNSCVYVTPQKCNVPFREIGVFVVIPQNGSTNFHFQKWDIEIPVNGSTVLYTL